jgi:hypothetical protein
MADAQISQYHKYIDLQNVSGSGDPASAPVGGVFLFASGSSGSAKLYLQNEGSGTPLSLADAGTLQLSDGSSTDSVNLSGDTLTVTGSGGAATVAVTDNVITIGFDINNLSPLGGTGLAQSDKFAFSDGGTEKYVTFSNLEDAIFGNVSGDATIAAGGALTLGSGVVEHGMLAEDIISGQGELAQGGLAAADELMVSDAGTIKRYGVDSFAKDALALVTEAALAVADDYVVFLDGGASGETKKEQWADVVGNIAGDGLAAASGVLAVGVDDSSIELSSDALRVKAQGITNAMLADDAVGADELAANAVVNASVDAAAAIVATKLNFNVDLGGDVTFGSQADDTVTFTGHVNVAQQLTASHARITNLDVVTINSLSQTETTLEISDKLIVAALSASSANADAGGLRIGGGASDAGHADLLWDHSNSALDFNIGGTTEMRLQDGVLRPETDNDVDLGASGAEFKDLYLDGVAYIDTLQADALGANLDHANFNSTNVDIDSGAIDGTIIGAASQAAGQFTTLSGSGAATFASTVTAGGNVLPSEDNLMDLGSSTKEWKDLYIDGVAYLDSAQIGQLGAALDANSQAITNINVDSGAIDGTVIGANSQAAAEFTTMSGSSHASVGGNLIMGGNGNIVDGGSNGVIGFDGSGNIGFAGGYGSSGVSITSAGALSANSNLTVGADGAGANIVAYGAAANELMRYDASNHILQFVNSSGATQLNIGGDASSEYAIDVANGSDNQNKVRAAAFVTYSDESLKQDVASMSNTALDTVMSLEGVEFTWKDSGERDFGFIAQDVQSVLPKAVHVAEDGVQGVDYSRLTSVLVEAVKAQQVQIEDLKKTITNLKK